MGRAPCCDKANVKRGPWSPEEDSTLKTYLSKNGTGGNWISLPQRAGLKRCGKSCRLRWLNYLRPDIKHGAFSEEEDNAIISLYSKMGSRWSVIAANLPGRTDNDVKNHWNTKLKKRLFGGESLDRLTLTTKFNPKIKNLTFTNDIINPLNYKPPTSSSTPTPSSSSPSPTYLDTSLGTNYGNYTANLDHNHHQFYVTIPSFSDLLAECTSNVPISTLPSISCYNNSLYSSLDFPSGYHHNSIIANSSSSPYSFDHFLGSSPLITDHRSASAGGLYESNNVDEDRYLSELGFGSVQEVMINSTSKYGDEEDIKPQGIGQGLINY